jgi:hypothetical protein
MQPKHPPEVGFRLAVALQPPENGPPENQKFSLIRSPPESFRQYVRRFACLFQPVQQPGKIQASLDMAGLELEQLAVRPDRLSGERPRSKLIGLLQTLLGLAPVPGGNGRTIGRCRWSTG